MIWGRSDLKKLSILNEFVDGLGSSSRHSLSICESLEADFLRNKLSACSLSQDVLFIDLFSDEDVLVYDETIIKPICTFKLMIKALNGTRGLNDPEGDVWRGRAANIFLSMVPYIESVFSCHETVPGKDITDTAQTVAVEKVVPLKALMQAITLPTIKKWLLLEKESKERENLISFISDLPDYRGLSETSDCEVSHYNYLKIMADDLFQKVAPNSGLLSKFERMKSMIRVGRGHIVIKVPSVDQYAARKLDTVTSILASEISSSMASRLGTRVESGGKSIIERPQQRPPNPAYLSLPYCAFIGKGALLSQLRAMGYQACLDINADVYQSLDKTTLESLSVNVATNIHIDGDCFSLAGTRPKDSAKWLKMIGRSTAIFIKNDKGNTRHKVVNIFE